MTNETIPPLQCLDLGYCDYREAFQHQRDIHRRCVAHTTPDTLIFQESTPVISLGRGASEAHLLLSRGELKEMGIDILEVSRGGDISYHGPGQLVVSPVLHLTRYVKNARQYVRQLEAVIIETLAHYGVVGEGLAGLSGVWVRTDEGFAKIAALGVSIDHGVTCHGFSLNVAPDMSHFETIIPCGIKDYGVTSLAGLQVRGIALDEMRTQVLKSFSKVFGVSIIPAPQ